MFSNMIGILSFAQEYFSLLALLNYFGIRFYSNEGKLILEMILVVFAINQIRHFFDGENIEEEDSFNIRTKDLSHMGKELC